MKNRGIIIGCFLLIISLLLGGCSLAQKDGEEIEKTEDYFVGVFITTEYIEVPKTIDEYLSDNGRIYATEKRMPSTPKLVYDFSGIEGVYLLYKMPEADASGIAIYGEENFLDVIDKQGGLVINPFANEDKERDSDSFYPFTTVDIEGTMYGFLKENETEITLYMNPIYQTSTGKIYMTPSEGITYSKDEAKGFVVRKKFPVTEHGVTYTRETGIDLSYKFFSGEPIQIDLYHMNSCYEVIKTDTYDSGCMPELYNVDKETKYIIAETIWSSGEITREMLHMYDDIETLYKANSFVLAMQYTDIRWEE